MMTRRSREVAGFTLIELMIAVVIATILITIAVPSYQAQIRKSRRTEAKTTLLDLAGREERYVNANPSANPTNGYTTAAADLGYTCTTPALANCSVGSNYYTVTVAVPDPNQMPATPRSYLITATPANSQAADTDCATFSVDNLGRQTATPLATCWN